MIILSNSLSLAYEPATSDTPGYLLERQMLVSLPTPDCGVRQSVVTSLPNKLLHAKVWKPFIWQMTLKSETTQRNF